MWLIIHAGIKSIHVSKSGPWQDIDHLRHLSVDKWKKNTNIFLSSFDDIHHGTD